MQRIDLAGEWLQVHLRHDLFRTHDLRRLGGERLALCHWRVPAAAVMDLGHLLRTDGFAWSPAALDRLQAAEAGEIRSLAENHQALLAKLGAVGGPSYAGTAPLLPHQETAARFLRVRRGALLCDEQGLGKTLSALAAFGWLRREGE